MSTKSTPFYWISCDAEGCEARCPGEYSEFLAFATEEQAREDAGFSDWALSYNDTEKDYCPDHIPEEEEDTDD